jgi:hypothetical protein
MNREHWGLTMRDHYPHEVVNEQEVSIRREQIEQEDDVRSEDNILAHHIDLEAFSQPEDI